MKLNLEVRSAGEITILHCRGRLTYRDEATRFSQTVAEMISETSQLIIDMTGLESIDSAGLGELAVIHMWARASRCALKLAGLSFRIRDLLELTNLLGVFETYPTLEAAIASFEASRAQAMGAA